MKILWMVRRSSSFY